MPVAYEFDRLISRTAVTAIERARNERSAIGQMWQFQRVAYVHLLHPYRADWSVFEGRLHLAVSGLSAFELLVENPVVCSITGRWQLLSHTAGFMTAASHHVRNGAMSKGPATVKV